jgi:hypothetical protein
MSSREEEGGGASRSTDPAAGSSSGTDVSLREYFEALRHADDNLRKSEQRFEEERDRRYKEVALEREKALKIKEEADKAALGLAREIQTYKDEKANELREQINSERGLYATKDDVIGASEKIEAQLKPLQEFVTGTQGRQQGVGLSANVVATVAGLVLVIIGLAVTVYLAKH